MKKILSLFVLGACIHLTVNAQGKEGAAYFTDNWNVLVKGIPQGDTRFYIALQNKDGQLVGDITDTAGNAVSKVEKTDVTPTTINIYFHAQGYDVTLTLNKKDDDHVTGTLMNMFDAEGQRMKGGATTAAAGSGKSGAAFFADTWDVLLKGIPQGDTHMMFKLQNNGGQISGDITDATGNPVSKVDKAEVTDTAIVLYFHAQGYDVSLTLNKKDEDHLAGSLMNMFDAEGVRVKK
jgi:hypothetical protein